MLVRLSAVARWTRSLPGWPLKNAAHMRIKVEIAAETERDFALIFDHFFESYRSFQESSKTALDLYEARIRDLRQKADGLGTVPYHDARHDNLLPGLRHLTIDRSVYQFDVNQAEQRFRVNGITFGGQDHVRHMLTLLLAPRNALTLSLASSG